VIKRQFGYTKVRYRGLAKNGAQVATLFALSNLWMARKRLLAIAGKVRPQNGKKAVVQVIPALKGRTHKDSCVRFEASGFIAAHHSGGAVVQRIPNSANHSRERRDHTETQRSSSQTSEPKLLQCTTQNSQRTRPDVPTEVGALFESEFRLQCRSTGGRMLKKSIRKSAFRRLDPLRHWCD